MNGITLLLTFSLAAGAGEYSVETLQQHYTDTIELRGDGRIPGTGRIGGIAVDGFGYVYVANFDNGVWRIDPSGRVSLFAEGFYGASGNTVLPNGDLLQSDFGGNRLLRIDRRGRITTVAETGLNGPVGVTATGDGHVYVANYLGHSLARISPDGDVSSFLTHDRMKGPNSVVADPEGNLYVASMGDNAILRVSPEREVTVVAELPGQANAHLALLEGALYVTKIWDHVVLRVSLSDGAWQVVSGQGRKGFSDGAGTDAGLAYPNGIAARGGMLYVNTLDGNMVGGEDARIEVRRIHPPNVAVALYRAHEQAGERGMMAAWASVLTFAGERVGGIVDQAYRAADRIARTGDPEAGLALLAAIRDTDPDRARGLRHAGEMHQNYGDRELAESFFRQWTELEPDNVDAARRLQGAREFSAP